MFKGDTLIALMAQTFFIGGRGGEKDILDIYLSIFFIVYKYIYTVYFIIFFLVGGGAAITKLDYFWGSFLYNLGIFLR